MRVCTNPLHLDVVEYPQLMGDKTLPGEARRVWGRSLPHSSLVSIYHDQGFVDFCLDHKKRILT